MANFNAHIIASGNIQTHRVFIGNASGLFNIPATGISGIIPSGNLPTDIVYDTDLLSTSGYLQSQITAAGTHTTLSGVNGGSALSGNVVVSGYGATIYTSGAALVIEPDVRRAELLITSGVNTAILTHGFSARPLVQFFDLTDEQIFADISHNSVNEVQIDFLELQTGRLIVIG